MEIRSTQPFNAIPATLIRGVFNLYLNLLYKIYCKYFIYLFIYFAFSFSFNGVIFFYLWQIYTCLIVLTHKSRLSYPLFMPAMQTFSSCKIKCSNSGQTLDFSAFEITLLPSESN